jgi:hypothetical protein|tara:strand:+ start:1238 stop:2398 length:1161 start_codon:yes stop_codon:yes gene_type:complete
MLKEQSKKLKITAIRLNKFLSRKGKAIRNLKKRRILIARKRANQKRFKYRESSVELLSPVRSSVGMIAKVISKVSPIDIFNSLIQASGLILTGIIINNLPEITKKFNEVLQNIIMILEPLRNTFEGLRKHINERYPRDKFKRDKENFIADIRKIKEELKPLEEFGKTVQDYIGKFKDKILVMFPELKKFIAEQYDNFVLNQALDRLKGGDKDKLGTETFNEAIREYSPKNYYMDNNLIGADILKNMKNPLNMDFKKAFTDPDIEIKFKSPSFIQRNIPFYDEIVKSSRNIKNILLNYLPGGENQNLEVNIESLYKNSEETNILEKIQSSIPVNKEYQLTLNNKGRKHVILAYQQVNNNIIEYVPIESNNIEVSSFSTPKISNIWRS